MTTSKSSLMFKLATVSAALAVQGAAFAATSGGNAVTEQSTPVSTQPAAASTPHHHGKALHHKGMRHHHHRNAAMWVPGYGSLNQKAVQQLGLNDSQAKLLADAQTAQKESRKSRYESMKAARSAKVEQLKAGNIDPHAKVKEAGADRQKIVEARQQINDKWFAVWDALDPAQQKKVAAVFSERAQKISKYAQKRHDATPSPANAAAS